MKKPRTERLLDLLKENPDGLSLDQLIKMLKTKNGYRDIGNTLQLLKRGGHKIVNHNGNYMLYSEKVPPPKRISAKDNLIDVLSKHHDGISTNELIKSTKTNESALHNRIYWARKNGHNIEFREGKYFLSPGNLLRTVNRRKQLTNTQEQSSIKNIDAKNFIPKQYHDALLNLSDANKADCIDMLFKSIYYYKSALSLLETNKELHEYISSLEGSI